MKTSTTLTWLRMGFCSLWSATETEWLPARLCQESYQMQGLEWGEGRDGGKEVIKVEEVRGVEGDNAGKTS